MNNHHTHDEETRFYVWAFAALTAFWGLGGAIGLGLVAWSTYR